VLFRHDQHVHRGLGIYVVEGDDVLVLPNFFGRDYARRDLAEDAILHR
jgi:hypothetical protein